jgi:trehalose 6-phosphate phosphatase
MKEILSGDGDGLLARFAASRVLLAFDFDGTLAPIRADRDGARMRPRTGALLRQVCSMYPCAVISGRDETDLAARVEGAGLRHVIGNHGLVSEAHGSSDGMQVGMVLPLLVNALRDVSGVEVEAKRASLAIHYRNVRNGKHARRAISAAIASLPFTMRVLPGKRVVNLLPLHGQNKGRALRHLRERERLDVAVYVGDDGTDEDVFTLDEPDHLLSIRIGVSKASAARYHLKRQRDIDGLLARLAALRSKEDE